MVRERKPLQPTQLSQAVAEVDGEMAKQQAHDDALTTHERKSQTSKPEENGVVLDLSGSSPVFGEASPLRNPLKKNHDHIFNVPKSGARLEHHGQSSRSSSSTYQGPKAVPFRVAPSFPLQEGHLKFAPKPVQSQSKTFSSIVDARPSFSSINPPGGFQSVNAPVSRQVPVDLTNDDEDEDEGFDPNAALRDLSFGERDPFMFVDGEQANKDMKALLEGAFDETAPRIKLRKRIKPQIKDVASGARGLASKLAALEVKDDKPANEDDHDDTVDDGSVDGLKVKLLPHQVEGLAWMTDKEIGERKKGSPLPMGGILADDMGLGKTLQTMAVILTNPRPTDDEIEEANKHIRLKRLKMSLKMSRSTLIVAPLALIRQWESELKTKVSASHQLKILVHHGPSRTKLASELKKYDVVITTYQILASEHAGSTDSADGPKLGCFGVHWYRIVLDEAHTIKNRNAKSTKACYALQSHFRWCLTGTPMQNNLEELQSLIAFLRIKPYCDLGNWKEQISGPMKNGRGGLAMRRLQFFLKACMKRRTKDILKAEGALNPGGKPSDDNKEGTSIGFRMVERKVESVVAEFNPKERQFYDNLSARAQNNLEKMMMQDKLNNMGALVLLLRLRQACNHPQLITANAKKDKDALEAGINGNIDNDRSSRSFADDGRDADDTEALADLLGGLTVETKKCDSCGTKMQPHELGKGVLRCGACEHDKHMFEEASDVSEDVNKKSKKKQHKHNGEKSQKGVKQLLTQRRGRRVVTDSDDEENGEGDEGRPVLGEQQSLYPDLRGAGSQDEEDAEGGGGTLGTLDTVSNGSEDDEVDESESDSDDSVNANDNPKTVYRKIYIENPLACTKVRHLLRILAKETPDHKVIVFSQFTSMLDLIEPFLRNSGFIFTRYDGSMKNDEREHSLNRLRTDKKTRVLLCSLKCGSLGLNLTAASRVVILEPFWNPFVEEQAIDRVHRLNQTVDVHVYKITIADSVEERILELQEMKRKLAAAAIEQGGAKGLNKLSMQDIMNLFKRDAELHHRTTAEDDFLRQHGRILTSPRKAADERPGMPRGMGSYDDYDVKRAARRAEDPIWGRR